MATLALVAQEVSEIRQLAGNRLTVADVPDSMITGSLVLGTASDYVFESVRRGMDLDVLSSDLRLIAERFADESDDDIANFVNQVLKPPQRTQMRRAVMYRCVGNLIVAVQQVGQERAGLISQTLANTPTVVGRSADWKLKQDHFYLLADGEIDRLNHAFGDDAFGAIGNHVRYTLFGITGG